MADDKPKLVLLADAKKEAEEAADDRVRLSVEQALELARAKGLTDVVVVGWPKEGGEYFFAASDMDGSDVNWLLDRAKFDLLAGNY